MTLPPPAQGPAPGPSTAPVPRIALRGGGTVPQIGAGTYKIPPERTRDIVRDALDVGYRHVDTAEMYGNEREVGEAVRASGLDRADVFVTSKLDNPYLEPDDARAAFERTLADLDLGYVDLFLVHWPLPTVSDYVARWRVLEEAYASGRAKAIGVSNFTVRHLERLLAEADVPPAVNQIEVQPYLVQDELRSFHARHGIVTEAWSPLARGQVLDDPVVVQVAASHGRTPAQVVVRWHLQRGDVVIPKASSRDRLAENADVLDFTLGEHEMAAITGLDAGRRTGTADPETFTGGH
ncbi:aldo/keto reductase [Luteimicrobium subarcticum]|uniref:2,5-diketo-D-gluconate reductase A n=1 Tax=Luteimicrobium subarcticum TaxID=620910 RepID=A0A2M8WT10_9MICO|nr:aldo/keto reductase [Luteimicrobium subarcticum]PJI94060.1 2,5-diketo-D-gluconate reductase A [Luteimicrobium subarcticum]